MDSEKQLKKLEQVLSILETDRASTDEVATAFEAVLTVIKNLKDTIDRDMASNKGEMDDLYAGVFEELKKTEIRLTRLSETNAQKASGDIAIVQKQLLAEVNGLRDLIPTLPDLTYLENRIDAVEEMIPKIPEEIKAEKIRDKLETLKKEERLDASAIKGLDKEHTKLSDSIIARAISIVDQRTSFLINKVSDTASKVATILLNYIIGDGVRKITVGPTAPTNPEVGDLWVDTT